MNQNREEVKNTTILEETASLIHDAWVSWASTLLKEEEISEERRDRWTKYMVHYEDLEDGVKEEDRKIARLIIHRWKITELEILRQSGIISSLVYEDMKERISNERNRVLNSNS